MATRWQVDGVSPLRSGLAALALAALGSLGLGPVALWGSPEGPLALPWWALAAGFAAAEVFPVRVPAEGGDRRVAFSSIPLLFGLTMASPVALAVGRLLGSGFGLAVRRPRGKPVLELGAALAGTGAAVFVYRGLLAAALPLEPRGWWAAGAAAVVSLVLESGAKLIGESNRDLGLRGLLPELGVSLGGAGFGLMGCLAVWSDPRALVVVAGVGGFFGLGAAGLRRLHEADRRANALQAFTGTAQSRAESVGMAGAPVEEAAGVVGGGRALLLVGPDGGASWWLDAAGRLRGGELEAEAAAAVAGMVCGRVVTERPGDGPLAGVADGWGMGEALVGSLGDGGEPMGALLVGSEAVRGERNRAAGLRLLEAVARRTGCTLQSAGSLLPGGEEAPGGRSSRDPVTGLPDRVGFLERIDGALARRAEAESVAVLVVDLDRFREINDTLGHAHGDAVLRQVARRLTSCLPDGAGAARLGGDEFGVLIEGLRSESAARECGWGVVGALEEPVEDGGLSLLVSGSVGVAVSPADGAESATLMRRAEVAMYLAKRAGSGLEAYAAERDPHSTRRLTIIGDLLPAVRAGQVDLHYQPKVRLGDGSTVGVEALVRWRHPRLGDVPPAELVELAEHTGLIKPLTAYVLERGLTDLARLTAEGYQIGLAVNVAARSLGDDDLIGQIARLTDALGLDPRRLTLEITETSMMGDSQRSLRVLEGLDSMGVRLSVDDFGTGYCSLAYLGALPVAEMKIDRSFVAGMGSAQANAHIVEAAITLGHGLGLEVVAEGVETAAAWRRLGELGCDLAQGYLISRPLPVAGLRWWLQQGGLPEGIGPSAAAGKG